MSLMKKQLVKVMNDEEEDKYHKPKKKKPMKSVCVCQDDGICQCDTELKKLVFESEIKAENSKGIFTGYGSIFGNEDQGNDIMQKGAFTKSLVNRPVSKVKMLYHIKQMNLLESLQICTKIQKDYLLKDN